jgi:hypothetical protein
VLRLELLPAGPGDCLWLEYGEPGQARIVLIDGGLTGTFEHLDRRIGEAIEARGASELHIDLLVVTHIDNDHINGILKLLRETRHSISFGDIWFNGDAQLLNLPPPAPEETRRDMLGNEVAPPRPDLLGLQEGDRLSKLLADRELPWNVAFGGAAAMTTATTKLPCRRLEGDLKLTLLGPPLMRLRELAASWKPVLEEYDRLERTGPVPEREDLLGRGDTWPPRWREAPSPDESVANGSSIVLLAELGERSLLLTGDAYSEDLTNALAKLRAQRDMGRNPLPVAVFKLPHHGSARNMSQDLLAQVQCGQYVISTDGTGHKHPDHQALLSILRYSAARPCLAFNYDSDTTRNWRDRRQDVIQLGYGSYDTIYADRRSQRLVLTLD